ncbi:MAG: histidinol-phosphate aminotransferase family protein, partial [Actinobacteria bacterium]|nr:histidinol-phosphate aminotransferase family protein [Actinomycetota bacterium]
MTPVALPLPPAFRPYTWAASSAEIAARHGLRPEQILRFDQNTPPLPGVPRVPLAQSFARLNDYPDGTYRELREAAAAYCGADVDQIVVGAGADELIALCARTYLGPGRRAAVTPPTYGLYRIVTELEGAEVVAEPDGAAVIWVCNPNNPTGELREPAELAALARAQPEAIVVVDEAYFEYAGATCIPRIAEQANLIVLRTLSKAFGLAALRVGYAVASPGAAAELDRRRPPASVSA